MFLTLALAEILSIKQPDGDGTPLYYIHYIDYNKRLDEWVGQDRLDLQNIRFPKKDFNKKDIKNGSRPCSPDREVRFFVNVQEI